MIKIDKKYVLFLTLITMVIALSSCNSGNSLLIVTSTTINEEKSAIPSKTITKYTETVTYTPSPTNTITATLTLEPTSTSTPTSLPSPTPLPDLSSGNPREIFENFLLDNGGCTFPCFLGIVPGETYDRYLAFLDYLSLVPQVKNVDDGIETESFPEFDYGFIALTKNRSQVVLNISKYTEEEGTPIVLESGLLYIHDDAENTRQYQWDNPYYADVMEYYMLPKILNRYGPPSEILIRPFVDYPDDPYANYPNKLNFFDVVLVYPENGFLIEYMTLRRDSGENYMSCPMQSLIELITWDPEVNVSHDYMVSFFSVFGSITDVNLEFFRQIDEVTEMDIDKFYEVFKESPEECIYTLKNLWDYGP